MPNQLELFPSVHLPIAIVTTATLTKRPSKPYSKRNEQRKQKRQDCSPVLDCAGSGAAHPDYPADG